MMRADRAAIETSASRPTTSPAPMAGPCIAETIGFEQSMTLKTRSRASRSTRVRASKSPMIPSISSKLPPAENALPAPDHRDAHVRIPLHREPNVREVAVHVGADGVETRRVQHDVEDTR